MPYELMILIGYLFFITSLIFMANNIQRFAEHPTTEAIFNSFRYNLRDIPRVNYKEISSDESESESEQEQEQEQDSSDDEHIIQEVRKRRDRISMSRIVDESLD
jgi:hypothetical protein